MLDKSRDKVIGLLWDVFGNAILIFSEDISSSFKDLIGPRGPRQKTFEFFIGIGPISLRPPHPLVLIGPKNLRKLKM